ncbi:hypothetical protein P3551_21050 [Vibrio parahaemolyticus]|uniref:hypothetical protein n=1 Tax=Vibrio parahaemolyticus TaxID=670 RepID=UPI001124BC7F|nr:hypothetical protein [Vibrio parahaemolyticus]MBE3985667.1 hypothetical protein [Vibrio parahaemolyticus]MBE4286442.1 hypothetical protein [Vibrio parahaemolyticus]MDF4901770.1 hypothetical protein [Vibrio parahaemolyticus]TOH18934.1 hypothetical protein CGI90_04245 [Vibrio parahaemolyticus]HCG7330482.1 hypothetical protein [Vibrio parahaemolyticus]
MAIRVGAPDDDGISEYNKCRISQFIGGTEVMVTAYMTEECMMTFQALWESPFEGDSLGDVAAINKTASLAQAINETTSKTVLNSQQVWQGNEPPEISLTLRLHAYTNAKIEVDDPIKYLCQMISPELQHLAPISSDGFGGRIPADAAFNIGRKFQIPMRISEVSFNANAPKTNQGNFAYNTVTVVAAPKTMINKSQIPNIFKF